MAVFENRTQKAVASLSPARAIKTSKPINTGDIQAAAQDIIEADQARGDAASAQFQAQQSFLQAGEKAAGMMIKSEKDAEQKANESKFYSVNAALAQSANNAKYQMGQTTDRGEINQAIVGYKNTATGLINSAAKDLPPEMQERLRVAYQTRFDNINQTGMNKIRDINYDTDFLNFKGGAKSVANQLSHDYVAAQTDQERAKVTKQIQEFYAQTDHFVGTARTLAQRNQALGLQDWAKHQFVVETTPPPVVQGDAVTQVHDASSANVFSSSTGGKKYQQNVFFNAQNPHDIPMIKGGNVKTYSRAYEAGVKAEGYRAFINNSHNSLAALVEGSQSNDSAIKAMSTKALQMVNHNQSMQLVTNMNPTGQLATNRDAYLKVMGDPKATNDDRNEAYSNYLNAVKASAARTGFPISSYHMETPQIDQAASAVVMSSTTRDNEGKATGFVLGNNPDQFNSLIASTLQQTGGHPLTGSTPESVGINISHSANAYFVDPSTGRLKTPNNVQAQLDFMAANPAFQKHYANSTDLFRSDDNPHSILTQKSHNALVTSIENDNDFNVTKLATLYGVDRNQMSDMLSAQVEFYASKGDKNAMQTVKEHFQQALSNQHLVDVSSHRLFDEEMPSYVSQEVWDAYTGDTGSHPEVKHYAAQNIRKATYDNAVNSLSGMILKQWKRQGINVKQSDEAKELEAQKMAQKQIGNIDDFGLSMNGQQLVVRRIGSTSGGYPVSPTVSRHAYEMGLDKYNSQLYVPTGAAAPAEAEASRAAFAPRHEPTQEEIKRQAQAEMDMYSNWAKGAQ